jgi:hypothetical protein
MAAHPTPEPAVASLEIQTVAVIIVLTADSKPVI